MATRQNTAHTHVLDPLGDLRLAHARLADDIAAERAQLVAQRDALEAAIEAAAPAPDQAA